MGTWVDGLTTVPSMTNTSPCSAYGVTCMHYDTPTCSGRVCHKVIWLDAPGYQQWALNRLTGKAP